MSRPKNNVEKKYIEHIKKLAQQSFGKPLVYSFECELLSTDIEKVTGSYISPQTLRRLFGFLKTDFTPSVRTLNALSAYVGFPHWHSFTEQSDFKNYFPLTIDQETDLYLGFYKISLKAEADMNYHNASRNIAFRIHSNPALLSRLSSALAKNPVSQIYFFERFPFIDGLCTDYKRSIQLYLQKKEPEAQIFGNCLLFLSAFLSGRDKELKLLINRINKNKVQKSFHPFTIARYIGTNILFEKVYGGKSEVWIEEAKKWNSHILQKRNISFWSYPYFQHMIVDYLNLAELFEESYSIVRSIKYYSKDYEMESGYTEALETIYQIARHSSSPQNFISWMAATKSFNNISPLFRKFYQLQAFSVYYRLISDKKTKQKVSYIIKNLINQTGFQYYQKYLV